MDMAAIALQGLQQADLQLNQAAATIAAAGGLVVWFQPDAVSLSVELVALPSAKNNFAVNVASLKVAQSVQKQALDGTAQSRAGLTSARPVLPLLPAAKVSAIGRAAVAWTLHALSAMCPLWRETGFIKKDSRSSRGPEIASKIGDESLGSRKDR